LDVLANEVGGQVREASVIALGIAVLDHQVAALGVPSLFEAFRAVLRPRARAATARCGAAAASGQPAAGRTQRRRLRLENSGVSSLSLSVPSVGPARGESLLDDLVGAQQHGVRNRQAERLGYPG